MKTSELHAVIHYRDLDTALRNADIAAAAGCTGVFLIHMGGKDGLLDAAAGAIRTNFPGLKLGINRLATGAATSVHRNDEVGADSTWSDYCGVSSAGVISLGHEIKDALEGHPGHRFFGSVAFKYQHLDPNPSDAARVAAAMGFIPTTSGPSTGSAPPVEKLAVMAKALSGGPLAVASGITPENAASFLPYVWYFLCSTGISSSYYEFDPLRVRELALIINGT